MFIYAPQHIQPREIDTLTSQIDIAPTLLGLLNQSYESTFFGRDVLRSEAPERGRALLGNYQHLGLFDGGDLAILSPRKMMRRHDDALGMSYERRADKRNWSSVILPITKVRAKRLAKDYCSGKTL